MFRDKFWLSLALTIPTVLLSPEVAGWIGYTIPAIPGIEYVPAILGTIIFLYGGLVFIRGAQGELADRKPGMMTLISLAIIVAFVTSWAGTLGLFEVEIWWELATLITIMLLGHWLEMRSIAQAQGALAALADLLPDTAERVTADGTEEVPIGALAVGRRRPRPSRRPGPGRRRRRRRHGRRRRVDDHRRVPRRLQGGRRRRRRRTVAAGGSLRVRVTAVGRGRRPCRGSCGWSRAAQASASRAQALADRAAASCSTSRSPPARHPRRLVGARRPGGGARPHGDRARDRLPARPRPGDPARHRDLHLARRPNGLLVKDRLALERARPSTSSSSTRPAP